MNDILTQISGFIWGWPMIIMLLGTHLLLTIRLKFPQRYIFKAIRLSVSRDPNATGDVSQFASLATSLAATIGNGNIVGVATAVALGGPGAVFWCWVTGVFGIATKYGEGLLAVKYRRKTDSGRMLGGPMYALEDGLGWKWLAVLFCVFTAIASFGIGNMTQSNAISSLFVNQLPVGTPAEDALMIRYLVGGLVSLFGGIVIIGGVKGVSRVCSVLVPFMAVFYVLGCIYILFLNGSYLLPAVRLICESAFNPAAAGGGFVGGTLIMTARYGIARGLFSNESGMGSAPIVAAAAQTRNPVRQALVSSTGTFWDTVIICALSGLVLVSTMLSFPETADVIQRPDFTGMMLTEAAFGHIPYVGKPLLFFGIFSFAFSTILGWGYYGERAMEYLGGKRFILFYRVVFVLFIFIGAVLELNVVWNLSDIMNALMALPNLIALIGLSGVIVSETRHYLWEGNLDEECE